VKINKPGSKKSEGGKHSATAEKKQFRTYTGGFTVNPQKNGSWSRCDEQDYPRKSRNHRQLAEISRLLAIIAMEVLKTTAPPDVIGFLEKQTEINVPLPLEDSENKFFSKSFFHWSIEVLTSKCIADSAIASYQINYSDVGETNLDSIIGEFGAPHIDDSDDPVDGLFFFYSIIYQRITGRDESSLLLCRCTN
jgi:hypothetical protein